jgi:SWI/SNF-related matrix-associated actin-dependent regulator 1 of chromatin subfamily A
MERIIKRTASMAKYQSTGEFVIKINFDFNQQDLTRVRGLTVRYFHSDGKYWTTPLIEDTIEKLIEWGYDIDPRLTTFLNEQKEIATSPLKEIKIPGLRGELFPFQKEGVAFLESRRGRALIADEMGLGKTIQALAYLELHPELRPAIVVCPASLKLNWSKEAYNWMSHPEVQILSGRTINTQIRGKIIIINYDVLDAWLPAIARAHPVIVITDECHLYKSNTAQRTKAVKKLAKMVSHFIALSGTPIVNRPIEIFNAINIINPQVIPPYWVYVKRYCNAQYNGFGWDMNGASNTQELHDILVKSVMIRRL